MQYFEFRLVVAADRAEQLAEALACCDFHDVARSSRSDDAEDWQLWAGEEGLPPAVVAACAEHGFELGSGAQHDEAALLALGQEDRPFELCSGVWIQPGDSEEGIPVGVCVLHIPPGPAFGDGRHPSTRMAADLLPEDCRGLRVYDCGCGSGVLAVLAGLRGASRIDASDIDPGSIRATRALADRHELAGLQVFHSDLIAEVPADRSYDLFIGNLYADLLLQLLPDPRFRTMLPAGQFICSGIAQQRRVRVEAAMQAAGLDIVECREEAWWCALKALSR